MEKILGFADVHLGIRTHSVQHSSGLYDAEIQARIALEEIYQRASLDDIYAIICAGDMCHTSHPTTENITFFISWAKKMNGLGKPLFILPGNHDAGVHSHSMVFIHELNLENVFVVDGTNYEAYNTCFSFDRWVVKFAPYLVSDSAKDREVTTHNLVDECIVESSAQTIVVTHIHEAEAKIGSEGIMLSRKVPHINFDTYSTKNDIILFTGHIHKHQVYCKNNGIKIVYPGSLYHHDMHDVNQDKGYILINENGDIEFEPIRNIRKFVSYKVPEDGHVVDFLQRFRLGTNKYVFLNVESDEKLDEKPIREFLKSVDCKLGGILYKTQDMVFNTDINIDYAETDPYVAFNAYLDESAKVEKLKYIEDMKVCSEQCLDEAKGEV